MNSMKGFSRKYSKAFRSKSPRLTGMTKHRILLRLLKAGSSKTLSISSIVLITREIFRFKQNNWFSKNQSTNLYSNRSQVVLRSSVTRQAAGTLTSNWQSNTQKIQIIKTGQLSCLTRDLPISRITSTFSKISMTIQILQLISYRPKRDFKNKNNESKEEYE